MELSASRIPRKVVADDAPMAMAVILMVTCALQPMIGYADGLNRSGSPWPMFQHDVRHTGLSPFSGPSAPLLKWAFAADGVVA